MGSRAAGTEKDMKAFFKVTAPEKVIAMRADFPPVGTETVPLDQAHGRVLAKDVVACENLPAFVRATMDGYALKASSSFGASEGNPAFLTVKGDVAMGECPDFTLAAGEEHVLQVGEDIPIGERALARGSDIRSQEVGLLAALGCREVTVFKKPVIGIISTGDEIVAPDEPVSPGKIRDVNASTLAGLAAEAGTNTNYYGIVKDDLNCLCDTCRRALSQSDMVLISGGSSMGTRDLTLQVLSALPDTTILVHGILAGRRYHRHTVFAFSARLTRNLSSVQGRVDYVRVRLAQKSDGLWAEPLLGKSGLINTMIQADGLVVIGMNVEGLEKGTWVNVVPV